MTVSEDFRRLVIEAHKNSGLGVLAFERSLGLKPSSLKAIISEGLKQSPSIEKAARICDALDLEFYIGPRRDGVVSRLRDHLNLPADSSDDEIFQAVLSRKTVAPSKEDVRSALNDALNDVYDPSNRPQTGSLDVISEIHAKAVELQKQARESGDPLDVDELIERLEDEVLGRNIYNSDQGIDTY